MDCRTENLITFLNESRGKNNTAYYSYDKSSMYQEILFSYIKSPYFLFVIVNFIMNKRSWRKPILMLLTVHWIFRSTGDLLNKTMYLSNNYYPITKESAHIWYRGTAIANIFWSGGEIIGDWYPLLRTRAIINNRRKIRVVFLTCFLYNMAKVCSVTHYFIEIPRQIENPNMTEYSVRWYYVVAAIQVTSFIYDLSVIVCLRQNLFDQLKFYKSEKNTFIERFKKISELRIIISMISSLCFLPIILTLIYFYFKTKTFDVYINTENIRRRLIEINFNMIYIDQILLLSYVGRKPTIRKKQKQKKHFKKNKKQALLSYPSFSHSELLSSKDSNRSNTSPMSHHTPEDQPILIQNLVANYFKPVDNFYKDTPNSNLNNSNINSNNSSSKSYNVYYPSLSRSTTTLSNSLYPSASRSKVSNIKTFNYDDY